MLTRLINLLFFLFIFILYCSISMASEFKLTAFDGSAFDSFGKAVAMTDDFAIVGSIFDDYGISSGAAYIFQRNNTQWTFHQKLMSCDQIETEISTPFWGNYFGRSVGISDKVAVVGAYGDDEIAPSAGAAYIFNRVIDSSGQSIWKCGEKLTIPESKTEDRFGFSVAIYQDYIIIGAFGDDTMGSDSGAAYLFHFKNSKWTLIKKLTNPQGKRNDNFGYAVSITKDFALVGAKGDSSNGIAAGAAFVYSLQSLNNPQKLIPSRAKNGDQFGISVSIYQSNLIVGSSPLEVTPPFGSACIFQYSSSSWSEVTSLSSLQTMPSDHFASSVAISSKFALIGADGDNTLGQSAGAIYIYDKLSTGWHFKQKISGSDSSSDDRFGYSLFATDQHFIIGALQDNDHGSDSGAAYIINDYAGIKMTVSKDNVNIPARAGSFDLFISKIGEGEFYYTATSSVSWLTISNGKIGSGNSAIAIQYSPNNSEQRHAQISIISDQAINTPLIINVTQDSCCQLEVISDSIHLSAQQGRTNINVLNTSTGEMEWQANPEPSASYPLWYSIISGGTGINNGIVQIEYESNAGSSRTEYIKISSNNIPNQFKIISLIQDANAQLSVTPQALTVPSEKGSERIIVKNESSGTMPWSAMLSNSNSNWLSITNMAPGELIENEGEIIINYIKNNGIARSETINIRYQGLNPQQKQITIHQRASVELSVNPEAITVSAKTGKVTFQIKNLSTGIMKWTVTSNDPNDWLTIDNAVNNILRGTGNRTVYLSYSNNLGNTREQIVSISAKMEDGSMTDSKQVLIKQDANVVLSVSPNLTTNYIPSTSGIVEFQIKNDSTGTLNWIAFANSSWLTITNKITNGYMASNDATLYIQYDKNIGTKRSEIVTVKDVNSSTITKEIMITQHAIPILSVDSNLILIDANYSISHFNIINDNWGKMAYSSQIDTNNTSWIQFISGQSGFAESDAPVYFRCMKNYGEERIGTITITAPDSSNISRTIKVIQQANTHLNVTPSYQTINSNGGFLTFHVENLNQGQMEWTASPNSSWLTIIHGLEGMNSDHIIVQCDPNFFKYRVGTVTVFAQGAINESQQIEIRQSELKLTAENDREKYDFFGHAVSIDGDNILIGAHKNDDHGQDSGSAYLFTRNGDLWHLTEKLIPNDGAKGDNYGASVAIYKDFAVIGAYLDDKDTIIDCGSVYIYHYDKNTQTWLPHETKITASDLSNNAHFGCAISIWENTLLIGADRDATQGEDAGAAYIFTFDGQYWTETQKLIPTQVSSFDRFGHSVSIKNQNVVIGAFQDSIIGKASGSAYVYSYSNTTWIQTQQLTPRDSNDYDQFGRSVAISDNFIIIGAFKENAPSNDSGNAYIFKNNNTQWEQVQNLVPGTNQLLKYFGASVAISDTYAIVGAVESISQEDPKVIAYIYQNNNSSWSLIETLQADGGDTDGPYEKYISMSKNYIVLGAKGDDYNDNNSLVLDAGAVSVYKLFDLHQLEVTPLFQAIAEETQQFTISVENLNTASGEMVWHATTSSEWFTILNPNGINNDILIMACDSNYGAAKSATITIAAESSDPVSKTVSIWQDARSGRIPDTGQTTFYDDYSEMTNPPTSINDDFYGQDASFHSYSQTYTKLDQNRNPLPQSASTWSMILDQVTGLIWENKTNNGSIQDQNKVFSWYDSNPSTNQGFSGTDQGYNSDTEDYIQHLNENNLGGFSDWRIPSINELASLMDYENMSIHLDFFPFVIADKFWSSTTVNQTIDRAWSFDFKTGKAIPFFDKSEKLHVLAVRGGNISRDHFIINGDGTVTDIHTGLMWQIQNINRTSRWENAVELCSTLSSSGYSDWRLPNKEELRSIVNYFQYGPAIDTTYFPSTLPMPFWSATTSTQDPSLALGIDFQNGVDIQINKIQQSDEFRYYIRPVRGGSGKIIEAGETTQISWDTKNISDSNVKIEVSHQGGKYGTYEIITSHAQNSGSFNWKVNGPPSVNCMIKISSINKPDQIITQGVFSIAGNRIPQIFLQGNETMTIVVGKEFIDPGVTAIDNYDKSDISDQIITSGNVNTAIIGTHKLTYQVTGKLDIPAPEKNRYIQVVNGSGSIEGVIDMLDDEPINPAYDIIVDLIDGMTGEKVINPLTGLPFSGNPTESGYFVFKNLPWKSYWVKLSLIHPDYAKTAYQKRILFNSNYYSDMSSYALPYLSKDSYYLKVCLEPWDDNHSIQYDYKIFDDSSGMIIQSEHNFSKECFRMDKLPPTTYRILITSQNYAPAFSFNDNSEESNDIITLEKDMTITVPMKQSIGFNPSKDYRSISHIYNNSGFTLFVVGNSFADMVGGHALSINQYNGTGTLSSPFEYTWSTISPYNSYTIVSEENKNYTRYTVLFQFSNPPQTYTVTYQEYSLALPAWKNLSENDDTETLYEKGDLVFVTTGEKIFYPAIGTSFHFTCKDYTGKNRHLTIQIPPLPLSTLFFYDQMQYNENNDLFNLTDDTNDQVHLLTTTELIRMTMKFFTYSGSSLGSSISIELHRQSDGASILYNPYKNINSSRADNAPWITLPLLLNSPCEFLEQFNPLSLSKSYLRVKKLEVGDGIQGFDDASVSMTVQDDALVLIDTNHFSSFALQKNEPNIAEKPYEDLGSDCFVNVVSKSIQSQIGWAVILLILLVGLNSIYTLFIQPSDFITFFYGRRKFSKILNGYCFK